MNNQYIINELSKEAAYHINAYQEKVAALNSIVAAEKTAADAAAAETVADAAANPGLWSRFKNYIGDSAFARDARIAYNNITNPGDISTYGKMLNAKNNIWNLAKQYPGVALGAAAIPAVAGLGAAYGLGAFDGQPSPEAAGMMQGGMSPEEMMAVSEMAKQSSYNPNLNQNINPNHNPNSNMNTYQEKMAAYSNLITTLQQNPEFKQILMNM